MPYSIEGVIFFGMLLIGIIIGSVLLRMTCSLYNELAGVSAPPNHPSRMERHDERGRESVKGAMAQPQNGLAPVAADKAEFEDTHALPGVPMLSLGQALAILCVTVLIYAVAVFLSNRVLGGSRMMAGGGVRAVSPLAFLVAMPINLLVMAGMLPTSFGKGLLVSLLYTFICLVLGIVLVAIILVVALTLGGLH